MKTKALVRFLNRFAHYAADVEVVDVMARSASALATKGGRIFDAVTAESHPTLWNRKDSDGSRDIALRHLKATIAQSIIKDLYEDVTSYLQHTLCAAATKGIDPARFVGEHDFKIGAKDLLALGSWEAVVQYASDTIFRRLEEERSTTRLLALLPNKLGLVIDQAIVDAARPYLDARHRFVHHDGKVDAAFAVDHSSLGLSDGDDLPTTYAFVRDAQVAIRNLVEEFDRKLVAGGFLPDAECQP